MYFYQFRQISQVRHQREFRAVRFERKSNGIGGVMRNRERVDVNIANHESLARLNLLHCIQPLAKSIWQSFAQRVEGRFGDVERSLPHAEHLRKSAAVI